MTIILGADHNGFQLKERLEAWLKERGYDVHDQGNAALNPEDDYPQFAGRVIADMQATVDAKGVLICGSGQGMAIAANRFKGIRAVVGWNKEQAILSRNDDDTNVLALPAFLLKDTPEEAFDIVHSWLDTPFESVPRRIRRNQQLDQLG